MRTIAIFEALFVTQCEWSRSQRLDDVGLTDRRCVTTCVSVVAAKNRTTGDRSFVKKRQVVENKISTVVEIRNRNSWTRLGCLGGKQCCTIDRCLGDVKRLLERRVGGCVVRGAIQTH